MDLKLEIICKDFKHKKTIDNKLIVTEKSEEYYIIPVTRTFTMESDEEVFKLIFENQLLWLKYSNHQKEILIKEDYDEFIIIKAKDILDIYMNIHTTNCFKKNVWFSKNNVSLNKKYLDKSILIIPIFEEMISINEYGEGIRHYQIHMNSNEILLRKVTKRSESNCNVVVTNNILLNKEALFVVLSDKDVDSFL